MDTNSPYSDGSIDFAELAARLRRGLVTILGLSFIGLALGLLLSLGVSNKQTAVSSLRVTFGFPGFERGIYPNGSKFQADDIRAPDVINEAVKRMGIHSQMDSASSKLRGAIGVTGFVSPNVIKERDKLRAAGQTIAPYFPDEYEVSLSLPRGEILDVRQRELFLAEIVNVYLEKFRRSYVFLPPEFGNAFTALKNADFVEYELLLTTELEKLSSYLEQQVDTDKQAAEGSRRLSKQFRSSTNNLSFQDLLAETELFKQIQLNGVLSPIYGQGLSKDRNYTLVKMDYQIRTLEDQERRLKEEDGVVTELLARTQERAQNYVLATKPQNSQGNQPLLDQGFIDSLLANDAYNFLIRRALDAGLAVKRVQADKARLQERRQHLESFLKGEAKDETAAIANTQKALVQLESAYHELLAKVRTVLDDYARQEFADAVRISMQARTDSVFVSITIGAAMGLAIGLALGIGLSLLRQPVTGKAA